VDIRINKENGTIFYRLPPVNFFEPDMSNGSLDDLVTVLNVPFVVGKIKCHIYNC